MVFLLKGIVHKVYFVIAFFLVLPHFPCNLRFAKDLLRLHWTELQQVDWLFMNNSRFSPTKVKASGLNVILHKHGPNSLTSFFGYSALLLLLWIFKWAADLCQKKLNVANSAVWQHTIYSFNGCLQSPRELVKCHLAFVLHLRKHQIRFNRSS